VYNSRYFDAFQDVREPMGRRRARPAHDSEHRLANTLPEPNPATRLARATMKHVLKVQSSRQLSM
jgi:hypothetical protein